MQKSVYRLGYGYGYGMVYRSQNGTSVLLLALCRYNEKGLGNLTIFMIITTAI